MQGKICVFICQGPQSRHPLPHHFPVPLDGSMFRKAVGRQKSFFQQSGHVSDLDAAEAMDLHQNIITCQGGTSGRIQQFRLESFDVTDDDRFPRRKSCQFFRTAVFSDFQIGDPVELGVFLN